MRITRLELRGYERLLLNNIDRFVYTPESDYQLILGTNGSGKSSLLAELSPLPGHSSNFAKDGLKDITIIHRGSEYRLISDFRTGKHSFSIDGDENLNRGGTQQVQLQLVEQHFNGYNHELHEIVTGVESEQFTQMDINTRRKWITSLSTQDWSFALSLHKTLASSARDHVGAVKHLTNRLAESQGNLKALGSVDGLSERALTIREELNALLMAQQSDAVAPEEMQRRLRAVLDQIGTLSRRVVDRVHSLRYSGPVAMQDLDGLESHAAETDRDAVAKKALVDRLAAEYTEIETALHGFRTSDGITPENIETHLMELRDQLEQARSQQDDYFGPLDDADMILLDNQAVLQQVAGLFLQLPNNEDRTYTRETLQQRQEEHRALQDRYSHLDGRLLAVLRRITLIEQSAETNCPACGYVWREGISPGELEELRTVRSKLAEELESVTQQRAKLEEYLERATEIANLYSEFRSITTSYPRLRPLWTHIAKHRLHLIQPAQNVGLFTRWDQATRAARTLQALERRLRQLTELEEQWSSGGGAGHLGQRMAAIVASIEVETQELNRKRNAATRASEYLGDVRNLANLTDQLELLADQLDRQRTGLIDAHRDREIEQVKNRHHNELAGIQSRLTEHNSLSGLVRDLERDLESTKANRDALMLLAKALSPKEGLIADQLKGFISCLTAQLNSIIASVWNYDLEILPCGLNAGDLDYRFQLQAKSNKPVPDVSKGSKAQKQIVNLAFQLTVMLYKGLQDFPLFLDEPGEGFDEQHRTNLMSFIKQLMDSNQHSQLFMISHYASNHGMFTQADVTVLDASNIAVAGTYNQHVVLG